MHAAIPMIGFGFMDNLVMIQAGEVLDLTLGVAFGLSTLTAAGFGQCVSDVAGITCGGIVDAVVARLNLPAHGMTEAQITSRTARIWRTLGGCVGVVTGCLLGMSILLFKDTAAADRMKRANELTTIFRTVMQDGHKLVHAERATLWLLDKDSGELWSKIATGEKDEIRVRQHQGVVGWAVQNGETARVDDAYQDPRFNQEVDKRTGYRTRSLLVVPIKMDTDGRVIGAIQIVNKVVQKDNSDTGDRTPGVFDEADERMAVMLSRHVATFIDVVENH
ncbi:cGMP-specific 3',5'-cyclic phosphodiesterase [Hondaea fermentalgiana]|uniref:cGMP-specific 3',5'-cyclic phosphodiesterase n=1 Tax=Hondaea fermentalgiana TaxID=2315210 RepID=A0A2R5GS28_9STRA|nr:cGMP-specific 3',5'-cyclic phosphodiesterase [Hondaea fermentalgiana]|eukprot:GBG30684.1 cGMP-specific 3',5'-cyclic phosphodiesterase [Hondaea fermentalgiana]